MREKYSSFISRKYNNIKANVNVKWDVNIKSDKVNMCDNIDIMIQTYISFQMNEFLETTPRLTLKKVAYHLSKRYSFMSFVFM